MRENNLKNPVHKLVFELAKLPSIGERTATRLAYYLIKQEDSRVWALADAIRNAKQKTWLCSRCHTFTHNEDALCELCNNPKRDQDVICVVEQPSDVNSIERSVSFRGTYHVLHGVLSPLDGVGPENIKIKELLARMNDPESKVSEVILATNPSVEGDATALYITKLLKARSNNKTRVTKLAHGIPVGGVLEYTDRQTISRAIENRTVIE